MKNQSLSREILHLIKVMMKKINIQKRMKILKNIINLMMINMDIIKIEAKIISIMIIHIKEKDTIIDHVLGQEVIHLKNNIIKKI